MGDASFDGSAHGFPDRVEVVPNGGGLSCFDIFPVGLSLCATPGLDVAEVVQVIDVGSLLNRVPLLSQGSSSDAIDDPGVFSLHLVRDGLGGTGAELKFHAVGVVGEHRLRFPNEVSFFFAEHLGDGEVREVTFSRGGETAVECDAEASVFLAVSLQIDFGGFAWSHRVAGGRSLSDAKKFGE